MVLLIYFNTCTDLVIQSTGSIQAAERCVYVDGYLKIHVRTVPGAMEELRTYLGRIQNVSNYVMIYGSLTITSLDFLTSLRYIGGKQLYDGKYSLIVNDMVNLQTLFTTNVTENLHIGRGTMRFFRNPVLCLSEIEAIMKRFPVKPNNFDLPKDTNGYSGGCAYMFIGLQVTVLNESSVMVKFPRAEGPDYVHYSILYIRLPIGAKKMFVPETCSESEWHAVEAPEVSESGEYGNVILTSLHPASTYALCVERYQPKKKYVTRSQILNFTTPVGKPEPPFIVELVASSSDVIVLRWVDHKVYQPHITRYELDVALIEITENNIRARDHCKEDLFQEIDDFRHAVVMRPPPNYAKGCESICGVLSASTAGALVEEYFDVCSDLSEASDLSERGCNGEEITFPGNSSFGEYVRTLSFNISAPRTDFQVGGLALFRDYRFWLRACSAKECSRSARGVVRTLHSIYADVPTITFASVNEFGHISVSWKPPELVNGAVLAYSVEVVPRISVNKIAHIVPRAWCVPSTKLSLSFNYIITKAYLVRICSTSLASKQACGEWLRIEATSEYNNNSAWVGAIFGLLFFGVSIAIGRYWRKRRTYDDVVPLTHDFFSYHMESDPAATMMTSFAP